MLTRRAISEFRNVVVNFATMDDPTANPTALVQLAMPIDAYKAAMGKVEQIESVYKTSGAFTNLSAATILVTGTLPYQVHVFELTTTIATGTYNFTYVETVPNAESVTP